MTPFCTTARELLLENRGDVPPGNSELRDHLGSCSECAVIARRTVGIASALAGLRREHAPRELEGLAVAAMYGGHREDRAVKALRSLARLPTPVELSGRALDARGASNRRGPGDSSVAGEPRAPAVLDRLVDEDLRDASATMSRRFASRLERQRAPHALRERLERSAQYFLRPSRAARRTMAAAAAVLLLAAVSLWVELRGRRSSAELVDFQVRHETSLDAMDPAARALLGGLSGGFVDVGGKAKRQ